MAEDYTDRPSLTAYHPLFQKCPGDSPIFMEHEILCYHHGNEHCWDGNDDRLSHYLTNVITLIPVLVTMTIVQND